MFGLKRNDCRILTLNREENNIGRHTTNHIVINCLPVSRYHSCIVRIDGRVFIKDKQTINGTFIGRHKILPDRETLLRAGDLIGIGCRATENAQCTFEVVKIEDEVPVEGEDSVLTQSLYHAGSIPDRSTDQSANNACTVESQNPDSGNIAIAKQSNSSKKKRCADNSVPHTASNSLEKKWNHTSSKSQKTGLQPVTSKTAFDTADAKRFGNPAAPDIIKSSCEASMNVEVVHTVSKPEVVILATQQKSDSLSFKHLKPTESSSSTCSFETDSSPITAEEQDKSNAASEKCRSKSSRNSPEDVKKSCPSIKTECIASVDDIKKSETSSFGQSDRLIKDDTTNEVNSIPMLVDASNQSTHNAENVIDIIDLSKSDEIDDNNVVMIMETTPESADAEKHQTALTKPVNKMDFCDKNSDSEVLVKKTVPKTCGPNYDLQLPKTGTINAIIDIKHEPHVSSTTPKVGLKLETCGKSVNLVEESSIQEVQFKIPAPSILSTSQSSDCMPYINLTHSDDEQEDIKPCISKIAAYSTSDEIVLLDSDEDFPCSQFDSTNVVDIPDFSSTFQTMYDLASDDDEPQVLHSNNVTWFKSYSHSTIDGHYQVGKELKVDLPIIPKMEPLEEINYELEDKISINESLAPTNEEAPVICDDIDGSEVAVPLNSVLEDLSRNEHSIEEIRANNLDQFKTLASQIKEKYLIRPCVVRIPQLDIYPQKLDEKFKRKACDHVEDDADNNKKVKHSKKVVENKQRSEKRKKKREHVHGKGSHEKETQPSITVSSNQCNLQEQRKRKEKLKEKLKKLAESQRREKDQNPALSEKQAIQPVAIKVTSKNRSAFLMDSIVNDPGIRKTSKKKTEKTQMVVENATKDKVEALPREVGSTTKIKTFDFLSPENQRDSREEIYDSYLSDKLGTNQEGTSINLSVHDMDISEDEIEKTTEIAQNVTNSLFQKLKAKSSSSINSSEGGFNQSSNKVLQPISYREALVPVHEHNVMKNVEAKKLTAAASLKYVKNSEAFKRKVGKRQNKSNLKSRETNENTQVTKKRVIFHRQLVRCKDFESDPEERRNNGILAPTYKLHERLIREEVFEFETAVAVVCKWNVKWLEEQKKYTASPELYRPVQNWVPEYRLMGEYKEQLKCEMYQNVWRAIFNSWNKPNQDILPHTQFVVPGNSMGLCNLQIDAVDTTRLGSLWTIYASREIGPFDSEGEIINGQIVILSFHVKQKEYQIPRKTMVFAYVASVHDSPAADGGIYQRIIFKIHQKDFEVMAGEIKIKTLTYTKTQLRPFQALSMVTRSPIMDMLVDPCHRPLIEPCFKGDEVFKDIFLDPSQRHAVVTCLNSIMSPDPSICIIDGAPGTGKSQVIVSLINELFSNQRRNLFTDDLKVLVVTSRDNIADDVSYRVERLDKRDCKVSLLRYGNCKRVHYKIRYCTLDDKVQDLIRRDDGTTLIDLENERRIYKSQKNSLELALNSDSATLEKRAEAENKLAAVKKILAEMRSNDSKIIEELKSQAAKEIAIENADVVVTSVNSCWSSHFENDFVPSQYNKGDIHKFTVCIFDDANYLNEIGMLIPMMLLVRSLILVGDSKNPAYLDRAGTSPFVRLVNDFRDKSPSSLVTLNTQHRMPTELSEWVCQYYHLPCPKKCAKLVKLSLNPLLVVNFHDGGSTLFEKCWWKPQAVFCVRLLQRIVDVERSEAATVAVIILREEQRDAIKKQMLLSGLDKIGRIRVDTVEQFSGRENEIVFVCVPVDFRQLDSWLYIASTRARSCLIICGYFLPTEDNRVLTWLTSYAKSRAVYASCCPQSDIPSSILFSKF